jgi:hypothetical protein
MGAPAPKYGTTRTGQELEDEDFALGGSATYTRDLARRADSAASQGAAAQNLTAGAVGEAARGIGNAGTTAAQRSAAADGRTTPGTNYGGSDTAVGANRINAADQRGIAQRLQAFADGPAPASAAQAQLERGKNDALAAGLTLARSGGGFGESAASLGQAGRQATSAVSDAATASAGLRAEEDQAWREQQLQAFGQAGDIYAGARSADLAEAGLLGGQAEFMTDAELRAREQSDAAALGWAGVQQGAYGQQLDALGMQSGMQDLGTGYEFDALATDLAAEEAALGGRVSQEEINQANYAAELQHQLGARELDQASDGGWVSGALGTAAAVGGVAAMFSDERLKTRIKEKDDLTETYAALGGEIGNDTGEGAGASVRSGAGRGASSIRESEADRAKSKKTAGSLFEMAGGFAGGMNKPKKFTRY